MIGQVPVNSAPGGLDYEAIFARILADEAKKHPSVKSVHIATINDPIFEDEVMSFLGYPGVHLIHWGDSADALDYEDHTGKPNGGITYATKLGTDTHVSTFIVLRLTEVNDPGLLTCYHIATLLHEMGHVDDIEKGKYLRPGANVDSVAAEIYANRYAMRRMTRENLRFPLGLLLLNVLIQATYSPENSVDRQAAKTLSESAEFKQGLQLAHEFIDFQASLKEMQS